MSRLPDLLERAAGDTKPAFTFADVSRRAGVRRARRRAGLVVGAALAVVAIAAGVVVATRDSAPEKVTTVATPGPTHLHRVGAFGERTGVTLVVHDGPNGTVALPLDRSATSFSTPNGAMVGEAGSPFFRVGNDLIVGSRSSVWRTDLTTGATDAIAVGRATTVLRATEPFLVWTVDQSNVLRLVRTDNGGVLEEGRGLDPDFAKPAIGVAKQVAYATNTGVQVFDPLRQRVTRTFGTTSVFVGDARGATVSWCEQGTTEVHLSDVQTGADTAIALPAGFACHDMTGARFSPSGTWLAIPGDHGVVLVRTDRGTSEPAFDRVDGSRFASVGWSDDGRQLFAIATRLRALGGIVARRDMLRGNEETSSQPLHGGSFAVLTNAEAATFLRVSLTALETGR